METCFSRDVAGERITGVRVDGDLLNQRPGVHRQLPELRGFAGVDEAKAQPAGTPVRHGPDEIEKILGRIEQDVYS